MKNWKKDIGFDEIGNNLYRIIIYDGDKTVAHVFGETTEKADHNADLILLNNNNNLVEVKRFKRGQAVYWEGLLYWVVEDNGDDKVLICNVKSLRDTHAEYGDWWVRRYYLV